MTQTSTHIPTLETDRLILRAPSISDFEPLCAFYDSERARYVGGQMDREKVWRHLALEAGHWNLMGYGRWTLVEKSSEQPCGMVGLWNPEGWPEPEIGWTLMENAQGHGFATEAAIAARDYAYNELGWPTAISLIDPANTPSEAVAKRLGASFETTYEHPAFGTMYIWRHPSAEDLMAGGMEAYA